MKITESDYSTGEVIEREATLSEIADIKNREKKVKEIKLAEADKAAAKQSAQAKLAALGLTEDEVTAIIGA